METEMHKHPSISYVVHCCWQWSMCVCSEIKQLYRFLNRLFLYFFFHSAHSVWLDSILEGLWNIVSSEWEANRRFYNSNSNTSSGNSNNKIYIFISIRIGCNDEEIFSYRQKRAPREKKEKEIVWKSTITKWQWYKNSRHQWQPNQTNINKQIQFMSIYWNCPDVHSRYKILRQYENERER